MSALNNYWAFLAPDHLRNMVHVLWQDDIKQLPHMRIGAHLPLSQLHSQNLMFQAKDCAYKDTKEPNVLASTSTSNVAQAICLFTPPQHAAFELSKADQLSISSAAYSLPAMYDPTTSPNSTVNPYSVPGCLHHWPHAFVRERACHDRVTQQAGSLSVRVVLTWTCRAHTPCTTGGPTSDGDRRSPPNCTWHAPSGCSKSRSVSGRATAPITARPSSGGSRRNGTNSSTSSAATPLHKRTCLWRFECKL